jgi:membrane-bound serine protease (ClpP class)
VNAGLLRRIVVALAAAAALLALAAPGHAAQPRVLAIHFDTEVNPVTQSYLSDQLRRAAKNGYSAAVILLDTPGGLSDSMRKIVQDELASPIPVIVYVSPEGARAASAGVWISEASDLLAMAPQTNIGSSTPIDSSGANIGTDLRRKVVNDAAASLRALSKSHGRNAQWADAAVRKASNLTAGEALRMNVIDMIAPTLPALLRKSEGYKTVPKGYTLHLAGAQIDEVSMGFFDRLLNTLIDPNLISLLFLAGIAGIGFEIFHPGVVLPGALGAVALVVALFGFSVLPFSWGGILLILLGVFLFIADAHVASHGALTVAGLISLAAGMLFLFHNAPAPYKTSFPLVISIAVVLGLFWAILIAKAVRAKRLPVRVGPQLMIGETGEVRDGFVYVDGTLWQAHTAAGEELRDGDKVRILGRDGLVLTVSRE